MPKASRRGRWARSRSSNSSQLCSGEPQARPARAHMRGKAMYCTWAAVGMYSVHSWPCRPITSACASSSSCLGVKPAVERALTVASPPLLELLPALLRRTAGACGQGAHAWEGHVLHVGGRGHVLRPQLALQTHHQRLLVLLELLGVKSAV